MMYARIVNMKLKKDSEAEFTKTFEGQVIPVLRKQEGFRDEISLLSPERLEVTGISFWNTKQNTDDYNRTVYPEILKTLSKVIEGTPEVKTFEVSNSTFHKIASGQAVV
jgi:heme-degrading monooxygenase HmoA